MIRKHRARPVSVSQTLSGQRRWPSRQRGGRDEELARYLAPPPVLRAQRRIVRARAADWTRRPHVRPPSQRRSAQPPGAAGRAPIHGRAAAVARLRLGRRNGRRRSRLRRAYHGNAVLLKGAVANAAQGRGEEVEGGLQQAL